VKPLKCSGKQNINALFRGNFGFSLQGYFHCFQIDFFLFTVFSRELWLIKLEVALPICTCFCGYNDIVGLTIIGDFE
jgi:hypothetical protein